MVHFNRPVCLLILALAMLHANGPFATSRMSERVWATYRLRVILYLPFLLHLMMIMVTTVFIINGIDGRHFYPTNHHVQVVQVDGSVTYAKIKGALNLQPSEVTTLVSFLASCTRVCSVWWAGGMTWRCAFLFMQNRGVSLEGVKRIFKNLPLSPSHTRFRNQVAFLVLLGFTYSFDYYSAILTGSITWKSGSTLIHGNRVVENIPRGVVENSLQDYRVYPEWFIQIIMTSTAIANLAWGRLGSNSTSMTRVLSNTQFLSIGSILSNVTVPYFFVDAFEWIRDPYATLTEHQKTSLLIYSYSPFFSAKGWLGLLPDGSWGPGAGMSMPEPHTVNETRLLAIRSKWSSPSTPDPSCENDDKRIPPEAGRYHLSTSGSDECFVFAGVSYRAGVGVCQACSVTSQTIIQYNGTGQNRHPLQLSPDSLTSEALAIAPLIGTYMIFANYGIPIDSVAFPKRQDEIVEFLSRSYQASWNSLTATFGKSMEAADVDICVKTTEAFISKWRLGLWIGLHGMMFIFGLTFTMSQRFDLLPWGDSPIFAAFMVDTSEIGRRGETEDPSQRVPLMLRLNNDEGHHVVSVTADYGRNNTLVSRLLNYLFPHWFRCTGDVTVILPGRWNKGYLTFLFIFLLIFSAGSTCNVSALYLLYRIVYKDFCGPHIASVFVVTSVTVTLPVVMSSQRKPPFGSRFITPQTDIWTQNAWDNVPPPPSHNATISDSLSIQRAQPVSELEKEKCYQKPERFWDKFYKANTTNFFRDRKWLHQEFPELVDAMQEDKGEVLIVELGCGTGASIFPLITRNANPKLQIKAYDYSAQAIKFVQANPLYASDKSCSISADTWDITSPHLPSSLSESSADIIILVFVLSALRPEEWSIAVRNIHKILKPSGCLLLRDYGRYDLTQLRFKGGRLLEDNFYIRGDKTRVYFFELDELAILFTGSKAPSWVHTRAIPPSEDDDGAISSPSPDPSVTEDATDARTTPELDSDIYVELEELKEMSSSTEPQIHPMLRSISSYPLDNNSDLESSCEPILLSCPPEPIFSIHQLGVDRRMIVNRKRKVKMYRVWVQGIFRKN